MLSTFLALLEPTHSERFVALLDRHWPQWREARKELSALPLGSEAWASATR
ncbi:MAG: M48 family peptidase [Ideonella sp. MAG2]|nr:MAG: M48 family peptidase [Ideonella sp. MAG2]